MAPCLVVLDLECRILSAESRMAQVLAGAGFDWEPSGRLPREIEVAVHNAATALILEDADEDCGATVVVVGPLLVRIALLNGPSGRCLAVSLEELRRRDPVGSAGARYRLSKREREVLALIIAGCDARQIAERLGIAESTVGEYFKHLNEKVGARNRSAMLAQVFVPLESTITLTG